MAFLLFAASLLAQDNLLLVVNESNPDSMSIGYYYAAKRDIKSICRLNVPSTETISRSDFETKILNPVADYLRANALQDRILYIVTTKGVPLTVEGASVDSALTLLYRYMLTGSFPFGTRIENPYFAVNGNFGPFRRSNFDIYLVTRLTSTGLVDRALAAQSGGSFYFDLDSPRQSTELDWIHETADALKKSGFKATVDDTATVLHDLADVQGYACKGTSEAPHIRWHPGSIAALMDKDASPQLRDSIESGATGFGFYVEDPLQDGYFRPQILFPAYAAGRNLAEAFYASSRYLGWRQMVVGDPLTAPYAKTAQAEKEPDIDAETGLPEYFSRRRTDYVLQKYSTSREAVLLLLKGEAAENRGNHAEALTLADQALTRDPYLADAKALKSRIASPAALPAAESPEAGTVEQQQPAPEPEAETAPEKPEDFPAKLVSRTPIKYPNAARMAQVEGIVVVNLLIDEMGQVMKAETIRGDHRLAEAVEDSVKSWRFEPKLINGRPVISTYTLPIRFRLNRDQ